MIESTPLWLIHIIAMIALILATITDIKKREVPDYLNFLLIGIGIFLGVIISILNKSFWPLLSSIAGLTVGYLFGALMFYTGQWGGGDSKMLMGLGALQGLNILAIINGSFPLFATTVITILIAGAAYGFIYAIILIIINRKEFKKKFLEQIRTPKALRARKIIIGIVLLCILWFIVIDEPAGKILALTIAFLAFFGQYLVSIGKAAEKSCMIKTISVDKLTEGDWIVEDIIVKGKKICGPKDLGISLDQITKLKKLKIHKIKIKEGIPFIPGFLIGYIIVIIFGNWVLPAIGMLM